MKELSEAKIFLCSCYAHALFAQRIDRDLHLDYFIAYRPEETDRVEDYYVQIPLSKSSSIADRMLILTDKVCDPVACFDIDFEMMRDTECGTIIKKYRLTIHKMYDLYGLLLTRTDICAEDDAFVWEWNAYYKTWTELASVIKEWEDELDDELYS